MTYNDLPYKEQKRQLILDVNKLVKHSDIIYTKSPKMTSKTYRMIDKIQIVKDRVCMINSFVDLLSICKRVYAIRKDLFEILPNPNNNSYENSLEKLNDILTFCSIYIRSKTRQYA